MIRNIFQIYKIGKTMGLTGREISNILFAKRKIGIVLFYMIILIIISFWAISIIILHINVSRNTYPAGAEYSSVKIKDFKKQNKFCRKKEIDKSK